MPLFLGLVANADVVSLSWYKNKNKNKKNPTLEKATKISQTFKNISNNEKSNTYYIFENMTLHLHVQKNTNKSEMLVN